MAIPTPQDKTRAEEQCPKCRKQPELCLCTQVTPLNSRLHVLILQHPQEPDRTLGSARLTHTALPNSTLKVGLSWPNLSKALGREAVNAKWGVLFLGGKSEKVQGKHPPRVVISTKHGETFTPEESGLEGIVVLDGTWCQAKTLWWRNAWLLKLRRIVLNPAHRSLYGDLRKEPRRECLSTLESVAEVLEAFGEPPETPQKLRAHFSELLRRCRELGKKPDSTQS